MDEKMTNPYYGEIEETIGELKSRIKELEEQLRISKEAHADTMNGQARRIEELERQVNICKDERDELRSLHDAGIKEAYRICGVEDDGEYRWKWVLLELSSRVARIKELEEGIEKYRNRWHTITRTGDEELYKLIKTG